MVVHGQDTKHMSVLAVINPACGDGSAVAFFDDHVAHKLPADTVVTTQRNAVSLINSATKPLTVVLASGDGTLHEILNQLSTTNPPQLSFVLIPCGTANALYSSLFPPAGNDNSTYRLQSLQSFLDQRPPSHLSLATVAISSPTTEPETSIASVVVSTSLHAAILHDSEALRDQHPGLERFKIAAQQNSSKWYQSRVRLFPCSSAGTVQIYDRKSGSFIPYPGSEPSVVHLDGPFAYFLSTFTVDRLEPALRITPLLRSHPPSGPACDIVIVRPLRDPTISEDTPEARSTFVPKIWQVFTHAYQNGSHIQLAYTEDGQLTTSTNGTAMVEYIRCGGWEWTPDDADADAQLVCLDGAIFRIPKQGKVFCAVDTFKHEYSVYGPMHSTPIAH